MSTLSGEAKDSLNRHISLIAQNQYCLTYFARQPRTFHELVNFKATEYRQIMLYTGPVIFKYKLYGEHYKVMKYLFVIGRMLAGFDITASNSEKRKILHFLKEQLKRLLLFICHEYGSKFTTFNLHSMYHLPEDCEK